MYRIDLADEQDRILLDESRLRSAVERVLAGESVYKATISLAVVDDPTIRELNRIYLGHDEATDVLSFALGTVPGDCDGEVIVSADTAAATAGRFGWSAADELLLYVVHGTLHLLGYDDTNPFARTTMRTKEQEYLAEFGLRPRYDDEVGG
jgi:probable rRNA maturation factor